MTTFGCFLWIRNGCAAAARSESSSGGAKPLPLQSDTVCKSTTLLVLHHRRRPRVPLDIPSSAGFTCAGLAAIPEGSFQP